ncbi:Bromodomain-containing protein [Wallemia mellicola]|nr:Bromodomain-containing protein [Wallemia mellicola]
MSILEEKRPLEEQEEISNKRQKLELYNNNVHDNIKVNKPLDGPDAQTPEQPTLKTPSHIETDTPTNEPVSHLSPQPKNIQHDQLSPVPVPEQPQLDKASEPVDSTSTPLSQQPREPVEQPIEQPQPSEPVQQPSEVVESAETAHPSQPSDSVQPEQPEQPSAPTQPSESIEPAHGIQSSEPSQSAPEPLQPEQAQPLEVTGSVQPVQQIQFAQPSESTQSAPVQTQQPSEPVQPAKPAESVQTDEPAEPLQPSEHVQPTQPIEPQQPSEQIQPIQQIEPQQPSEQIQTVQQTDQSLQQPEHTQVQSVEQPQSAEVKPELPQLMEDGQSEAQQPQIEPQPFDAPGVSYSSQDAPQDDFKEEVHDQSQPVVPPTPAGIEPIVLPNGTKLPPRSAAFGIPAGPPFSFNQLKFVSSLVKQLKKMKAAVPFLSPVDYISMGIPHYPEVISEPSDLGTVDRKVQKTIKAEEGGYYNFNDWETDVRRIFRNTEWFNGHEHPVSKMGKQVEESFDKQLKKMPPSQTNDAVPSTSRGRGAPRRSQETGRPRREVHHPAMTQNDPNRSKRRKTTAYGRNGTADQMRHCAYILKELHKKVHSSYASPFYDPVDYIALGLPDYPQVVQQPMDLSTVGQKLNLGDYEGPSDFFGDMKLMFGNCYKYNPPGTPVHEAGRQTEAVFDEKWTQLPPLSTPLEISDDENSDAVKALQRQIEDMQKSLTDIKKKGTGAPERVSTGGGGSGSGRGGKRGSTGGQVGRPRRKSYDEDDENYQIPEITFDMKKELAGKIQQLEGDQLDKAIKIIYETLDLDNNSDEIELDIDVLPVKTLQKLYMFVVKPQKQKRGPYNKQHVDVDLQPRPPKRAGTGGVKRKSMNEDEEALKIQALEAKLKSFEGVTDIQLNQPTTIPENDEASSGSDSDSVVSEDSGSESD